MPAPDPIELSFYFPLFLMAVGVLTATIYKKKSTLPAWIFVIGMIWMIAWNK